jgi:hypothetical protein|tara:strand:+ start:156 stop:1028 length:873 start_codon:yes stop_codon:yes gene_type:complete
MGVSTQYIDWWHEAIPGEEFDHEGSLSSYLVRPGLIYGISNRLNLSVNTILGLKKMNWFGDNSSLHHRDEHTNKDFLNAVGGILGDSKIIARYLFKNTGSGNGARIIFGSGVIIPSKNTITINPFLKTDGNFVPHRHFSLSNGTYNIIADFQYYYKKSSNPVFYGGYFGIEKPIKENEYSYLPSTSINANFSTIYKRFDKLDGSIDFTMGVKRLSQSYWRGEKSPNSEALIFTPSISYLFNVKKGALSIGFQKPFFIKGSFVATQGNVDQKVEVWQLVVAYRSMAITGSN